ncbi:MAG: hypothetical protein AAF587_12430 [Bacteroidota bacterium]
MKYLLIPLCLILSFLSCRPYLKELTKEVQSSRVYRIFPSNQTSTGDPEAGLAYLIHGDYIGGGIPVSTYQDFMLPEPDTILGRSGTNARIPYSSNAYHAFNGAEVVSGNCFTCHASPLEDKMFLGLGNSSASYQKNFKLQMQIFKRIVKKKVGKDSPEWEAFETYADINLIALPNIITPNPGVNPAFRLEEAYVSQRNPVDLRFSKAAAFQMSPYVPASDVPPLWNVRKKHALYYNGMGRGAFTKLLMQASSQGIQDSSEARKVHDHFDDVLAWIQTLEAPDWPRETHMDLVAKGRILFKDECSRCHGTYGDRETYPNKLVPLHEVQTDPVYARYFLQASGLADWYNQSWYATSPPTSTLTPSEGYIAPPLDGVWATAPYLHNGSVPTLEALLNSKIRPTYWQKSDNTYDYQAIGWKYLERNHGKDKQTYDCTEAGFGNQGHYFGDNFSQEERLAVLEYLKTL